MRKLLFFITMALILFAAAQTASATTITDNFNNENNWDWYSVGSTHTIDGHLSIIGTFGNYWGAEYWKTAQNSSNFDIEIDYTIPAIDRYSGICLGVAYAKNNVNGAYFTLSSRWQDGNIYRTYNIVVNGDQWGVHSTNETYFNGPHHLRFYKQGNVFTVSIDGNVIGNYTHAFSYSQAYPYIRGSGYTHIDFDNFYYNDEGIAYMPLNASFSSNVTTGVAPLTVQFNDTSTGYPTNWSWDFGDGSNSIEQNPVHIYTTSGMYNVTLTASNSFGSNTTLKINYIKVPISISPVAQFTSNVSYGIAPLDVQFNDTSLGYPASLGDPNSWQWNFGDGTPNSTNKNPVHTFSSPGIYTVTLTVGNQYGINTTSGSIVATYSGYYANLSSVYPHGVSDGSSFMYNITTINTGQYSWSHENQISLRASSSDAFLFGPTQFDLPVGIIVQPGESYTFILNLNAPSMGEYDLGYQMFHEESGFGQMLEKTIYVPYINPVTVNNTTYLDFRRVVKSTDNLIMFENDTAALAAGVDYDHAFIDTTSDTWFIVFRAGSEMKVRSNQTWDDTVWGIQKGEPVPCIYKHSLQVDEGHNDSFVIGSASYGETGSGACPWAGGKDATEVLYREETKIFTDGLIGELAGLSNIPGVGFLFTANDMIHTYYHSDDSSYVLSQESNMFRRGWMYYNGWPDNDASDASNFMWWMQKLPASGNDQFTLTSDMIFEYDTISDTGILDPPSPGTYTYNICRSYTVTLTAPPQLKSMSETQLNQCGIEKISIDQYQAHSNNYTKLSGEEIAYLKKNGKIYYIPEDKLDKFVNISKGKTKVTCY